ncbi:MAG: hypothetical protein HYW63_03235 [Candidatus Levybacteria bacterium]|nr:hypothetical protein [Candidatus Levybacteria bacterium]
MGQRSILISIVVIIFAVIFILLFILSRATQPAKEDARDKETVKITVEAANVIKDPLVYDGLTVEVDSQITDWVTKRVFFVNAGGQGLLGQQGRLLIISKTIFVLPKDTVEGEVGLGETVNVHLKGRVRIMDRVELERAIGLPLDGKDIALDDSGIGRWSEGSVLLLHSVERL